MAAAALVAALGGTAAQAARPEPAPDDEPCAPSVVALPAGLRDGYISAVAPSGRWQVGVAHDAAGESHMVRWDNGTPFDLGTGYISPVAVNSDGTIVGGVITGGVVHIGVFHDGQFSALPGVRDGDLVWPFDINEDGTVVGRSGDVDSGLDTPARWSATGGVETLRLVLPGDNYGHAESVDGDGSALGVTGYDARDTFTLTRRPVVWQADGSPLLLDLPDDAPDMFITLVAIRDGAVFANQEAPGGGQRVLLWDSATATPRVLTDGYAQAVSGNGAIVLRASDYSHLWLLRDQVRHELANPSSDTLMNWPSIAGVTESGVVYGSVYYMDARLEHTPLRWDCA